MASAASSAEKLHCVVTRSELRWGAEAPAGSQGARPPPEPGGGPQGSSTLPSDGEAAPCQDGGDSFAPSEPGPRGGAMAIQHIRKVQRSRGATHVVVETHSNEYVRLD